MTNETGGTKRSTRSTTLTSHKTSRDALPSDARAAPVPRRPVTRSTTSSRTAQEAAPPPAALPPSAASPAPPAPAAPPESKSKRIAGGRHMKRRGPTAQPPVDVPTRLALLAGQPGFGGYGILRPPRDALLGPAMQSPYLPMASQDGRVTLYYSCRPGGAKLYDLLDLLSLDRFGDMKWFIVDKEEVSNLLDNGTQYS